jgi:LuxR family transcriptional regulator, maltose regulon positive regulatory protein
VPRSAVHRPTLERRLDRLPPGGIATVIAPAGSGKSVLVRQWASHQGPNRVVWMQLDARHDDAVVFLRELLAQLEQHASMSSVGLLELLPVGGARFGPEVVDALLGSFAQLDHDVLLVLEDLHRIANRAVVEDLGVVALRLPPRVRLVVTSRWDPPWAFHGLRMDGRLVELRGADLAFGPVEGLELLTLVSGREFSDEQAATLVARTDGWAAGLQLAAISLQGAGDVDQVVASVAGTDRTIAEYLIEEVVDQLDPVIGRFLLRTSILEWFTPELCDAVTGESCARDRLEELDRRSLFLIPLDPATERYRYHHLFADLLRYRLRRDNPDVVNVLHASAARWLLDHGHLSEAVAHLLAAGDHDQAYRVISSEGHQWFEWGESATLVRWLTTLTDMRGGLDTAPVDMCVNLLAAQVAADESTGAAETHRHLMRRSDLVGGERVAADALHALLVFRELSPVESLKSARLVREALPLVDTSEVIDFLGIGGRDSIEVMALYAEGWAHFLLGDLRASEEAQRFGLERPGADYPMWRIYLQGARALVLAWAGHCTEATSLARGALGMAERFGSTRHEALTSPHLALAITHLDRLEIGPAAAHLAEVAGQNRRRLSSFVFIDLHRAIEARLLAITDGPKSAVGALREPSSCVVEAPLLADTNRAFEAQLRLRIGDVAVARALLSDSGDGPTAAARVDVALAVLDVTEARHALDAWAPEPGSIRSSVARLLREAAVLLAEDRPAPANTAVAEAVALADTELLRWPFLEVPAAVALLRRGPRVSPRLLEPLLDGEGPTLADQAAAQHQLIVQLTERELAILAYLPGRTRNQDIAATLFISINTLKSHLRSIYRKLDVTDRDEAITRATELGLL